jgi:hypothetical protein
MTKLRNFGFHAIALANIYERMERESQYPPWLREITLRKKAHDDPACQPAVIIAVFSKNKERLPAPPLVHIRYLPENTRSSRQGTSGPGADLGLTKSRFISSPCLS